MKISTPFFLPHRDEDNYTERENAFKNLRLRTWKNDDLRNGERKKVGSVAFFRSFFRSRERERESEFEKLEIERRNEELCLVGFFISKKGKILCFF